MAIDGDLLKHTAGIRSSRSDDTIRSGLIRLRASSWDSYLRGNNLLPPLLILLDPLIFPGPDRFHSLQLGQLVVEERSKAIY
jgi:hypothetical protein